MAAQRLDGKVVGQAWRTELEARVAAFRASGLVPTLAVVRVGDDPSSVTYGRSLQRIFERAGCGFQLHELPGDAPAARVTACLADLNADPAVHGIMLQEPVPAPLDASALALHLSPAKDVDGVHPVNAGALFHDRAGAMVPATALGGLLLLQRSGVELAGRRAVVVGRSPIVGRPLAMLLLHQHATVTIAHSRTRDLPAVCRQADLLAVAVGRPHFVQPDWVQPGAVVIDFGVNYQGETICGDVDPAVESVAGALSPTPGGTGAVTTAALLHNLLQAAAGGDSLPA
ncbi:MAG: bifunctional 5,10-methylenetetrahydrofolate dehydrogenase/5,10-methenyltetrahydrofolate cyclohydrolase [Fimbriimonadaceae bacterium]|nr:bifunctional 5,10-methylenetetrahydrofolate dehydrogenase/5,10-methenyltetrahydrofolate cyclohydrolase [Fimbriimonadaceae bacterium]